MKIPSFQKKDVMPFLIYLYLFLPFAIFIIGWTKPVVSIPVLIVLTVCFYRMVRSFPELWFPKLTRENIFKSACVLFIIVVWVYLSGIGKFVYQNGDHWWRNGMFDALVLEKWPVIYFSVPVEHYKEPVAFVYYFGFWLPPAIIGKLFGLTAGYFAQAVWAVMGIFLFYYLILAKYIKKIVYWPLIVVIFFSGLDILGIYLSGDKISDLWSTLHIEWWAGVSQYSSMTTQLFWVFNQAVPAWLATLVLLVQKKNRCIAVVVALTMITCTLPFVGLVFLAICVVVRKVYKNLSLKNIPDYNHQVMVSLRDIFTFENIVGGGLIGIISFLFLKTNIEANYLRYRSLERVVFLWLLFYMVMAGVFFIAVWKYQKHNYLLYYSALYLAVCPWIDLGHNSDFSMRSSIPALVIVLLLVIDTINKSRFMRDFKTLIVLVVILVIGSDAPLREIRRTTANTFISMKGTTLGGNTRTTANIVGGDQPIPLGSAPPWAETIYCGYVKGNVFFDYLARTPKER
jgi:hypothetical protein